MKRAVAYLGRSIGRGVAALAVLALLLGALPDLRAPSAPLLSGLLAAPSGPTLSAADRAQFVAKLEFGATLRVEKAAESTPKPPAALAAATARRPFPPYVATAPPLVRSPPLSSTAHRRPSPTGPPILA